MKSATALIKPVFSLLFFLVFCIQGYGQGVMLDYPKEPLIHQEDSLKYYLEKNRYEIDTNAQAVKLWELGDISVVQNPYDINFGKVTIKIKTLLKLISHESVQDFGIDYLPMDASGYDLTVKGTVFNLGKDSIQKSTFSFSGADFKDSNPLLKVPDLKEGSIVALTLTCHSTENLLYLFMLPTWYFEGMYPTLFSAYFVDFPADYGYRNIMTSSIPFKTVKTFGELANGEATFLRGRTGNKHFPIIVEDWEMRNIPAFHREIMMPSPEAYLDRVTIQFPKISLRWAKDHEIADSWSQVSKTMFKNNDFFKSAFKNNTFLKKSLRIILENDTNDLQKAQSIFCFVRDTFTNTEEGYFSRTGTSFKLKKLLLSRNGSQSDINVLLAAMLVKAGIPTDLVMVATKPHIPLSPKFPALQNVSGLICASRIQGKQYFLDASDKYLPFGLLSPLYYNGFSPALSDKSTSYNISEDSVMSHTIVFAQVKPDSAGKNLNLQLTVKMDGINAWIIRALAQGDTGKAETFFKTTYNASNFQVNKTDIKGLTNPDVPLEITYYASLPWDSTQSTQYLPVFYNKILDKNPFPETERKYPVDLGQLSSYNYYLVFKYPKRFHIVDPPKPQQLQLSDKSAVFTEIFSNDTSTNTLSVHASFQTQTATFPASEYEPFRQLWAKMISLSAQSIVLEKSM